MVRETVFGDGVNLFAVPSRVNLRRLQFLTATRIAKASRSCVRPARSNSSQLATYRNPVNIGKITILSPGEFSTSRSERGFSVGAVRAPGRAIQEGSF